MAAVLIFTMFTDFAQFQLVTHSSISNIIIIIIQRIITSTGVN